MDRIVDIDGLVNPDDLRAAWASGESNVVTLRVFPPLGESFSHREARRVANAILSWSTGLARESGVDVGRVAVSVRLNRDGEWGGRLAGLDPEEG